MPPGPVPLHVLVVHIRWPPETFIQRKLEGLAAWGVRVTVATFVPREARRVRLPGVDLVPLPDRRDPLPLALFQLLRDAGALALCRPERLRAALQGIRNSPPAPRKTRWTRLRAYLALARLDADVVQFEWVSSSAAYQPLFTEERLPVVVSCRGCQVATQPHTPGEPQIAEGLRYAFREAAAAHCVSHAMARTAGAYGLEPEKAAVIYSPIDLEFFRPADDRRPSSDAVRPLRILTVGRFVWVKGVEYALVALRRLLDRGVDATLDVVGDGPEESRVRYTISDLGLDRHVRLLGRKSAEEVRGLMRGADVFLLSSVSEGIANVALEAMACGVPVVTSDCGGMREAVTDGVEGFVVPVRDPEALAEALARIAADPDLRRRMGAAGRRKVEQSFRHEPQIEQFVALYRSVARPEAA